MKFNFEMRLMEIQDQDISSQFTAVFLRIQVRSNLSLYLTSTSLLSSFSTLNIKFFRSFETEEKKPLAYKIFKGLVHLTKWKDRIEADRFSIITPQKLVFKKAAFNTRLPPTNDRLILYTFNLGDNQNYSVPD